MFGNKMSTLARGHYSVMSLASKLGYQGYQVWEPLVDDHGVDLAVSVKGLTKAARIQVKASSLKTRLKSGRDKLTKPFYEFALTGRTTENGRTKNIVRIFSEQVDFVVLHGQDEDRYWIVPAHLLDGKKSIFLSSSPNSRPDVNWDDIARRKAEGESYRKIAESTGLSSMAIFERLKGRTKDSASDLTRLIRSYENKWELFEEYFNASTASGTTPP